MLNRERGLDALEVRESAIKDAVERVRAAEEMARTWKEKCARKEKERSTIEAQIVARMAQDGCVVLRNGDSLIQGGGGAVHQHTRVVERALEEKVAELKEERKAFVEEKAQWKLQRDEWAEKHGDAATRARELQLHATCLERGINIEHRKRAKDIQTAESEKRKSKRAMERLVVAEDEVLRAEDRVKDLKREKKNRQQNDRRTALRKTANLPNRCCQ